MQPEFEPFLRGVYRELVFSAETDSDPTRALTLHRAAETVANLLLQKEALPRLMNAFRPRLEALIAEIRALLNEEHVAPCRSGASAEALLGDLEALMPMVYAQARSSEGTQSADRIGAKVCALEREMHAAREAALHDIRNPQRTGTAEEEERAPTDEELTASLRRSFPQTPALAAHNIKRKKGLNTKEIYTVDVTGRSDWPRDAILRRNRPFDTVENKVDAEFQLLDVLHRAGVLVPRPLFSGDGVNELGRPFILLERMSGQTRSIAELGVDAKAVFVDIAKRLGELHRVDPARLPAQFRLYGTGARLRTLAMIERFVKLWRKNSNQPAPTLSAAFAWLRAHVDLVDETTAVVHGDYDLRNLLIEGRRVSAILDWELAHEGHPAEDLGYCRPQVEDVMPWAEFLEVYLSHGGREISDDLVRYFQIYGYAFRWSTAFSACDAFCKGRHSDLLMGTVGFVEHYEQSGILGRLLRKEVEGGASQQELRHA